MKADLASLMSEVAPLVCGAPNAALSKDGELRYGRQGSLSVDLNKGTWFDHEAGEGGGVLDLIRREKGLQNGQAVEFLKEHGLWTETPEASKFAPKQRSTIAAAYDYRGADGSLAFQVVRMEPKTFRQRRPDGAGGWNWSVKGAPVVPYRLPEVLAAIEAGKPVYVVEGEKDADALAALGLAVTCNAGGAGKWLAAHAEALKGANQVIILPDNDTAGTTHAERVSETLSNLPDVRIVSLPNLPEKGDVSDWLKAGGTVEELERLAAGKKQLSRVEALRAALTPLELIKPAIKSRYLVKGWFDKGAASVVYGEPGGGKTFLMLDLATSIAGGFSWQDAKIADDLGPVVYIVGEGSVGIRNRIEALCKSHPERMRAAKDKFLLLPTPIDLFGTGDAEALSEILSPLAPCHITVDTLARAMGEGDENSTRDMGLFVRNADTLRERIGAHLTIVHHSGKDASRGARGSGALRGAVDTEIELTSEGDVITATARKQRDMEAGKTFSYTLKGVRVGTDEDGDAVTSAIIVPAEPSEIEKPKRKKALGGQAKAALQALDEALERSGEDRKLRDFGGMSRCVTLQAWREETRRRIASDDSDCDKADAAFRQAWRRVQRELQNAEIIQISDDYVMRVPAFRDAVTSRDIAVTCHGAEEVAERDTDRVPPVGGKPSVTSRHDDPLEVGEEVTL